MAFERLEILWRRIGTGLALAGIGVGGSILALTAFPLVALLTRDRALRQRRIQSVLHHALRFYLFCIHGLRVADVEIVGGEALSRLEGKLIIANHPSLLDVVMIMATVPRVQVVVKHELWRNPFFRLTVEGAGYIRNDLDPAELLDACAKALKAGDNLVIFPEGTRSVPGRPIKLKRGFANLATYARADLQLVTITAEPPMLHKGNPWWRVPQQRTRFKLVAGECLDIEQFLRYRLRPLAARDLVAFIEAYYSEKLGHGRAGKRDQEPDRVGAEAGGSVS